MSSFGISIYSNTQCLNHPDKKLFRSHRFSAKKYRIIDLEHPLRNSFSPKEIFFLTVFTSRKWVSVPLIPSILLFPSSYSLIPIKIPWNFFITIFLPYYPWGTGLHYYLRKIRKSYRIIELVQPSLVLLLFLWKIIIFMT